MTRTAFDFETAAITDWRAPRPVGVAINDRYYAFGHPTGNNCSFEDARTALASVWDTPLVAHNSPFDVRVAMQHFGLPYPKDCMDTMVMAYLDNPHAPTLALKWLAKGILHMEPDEQTDLNDWIRSNVPEVGKRKDLGAFISYAPGNIVAPYAIGDTLRTTGLLNKLSSRLRSAGMETALRREIALQPVLAGMTTRGIRVDTVNLEVDLWEAQDRHATMLKQVAHVIGDINMGSPAQLGKALIKAGLVDENKLPRTPTGQVSTAGKNLIAAAKSPEAKKTLATIGYTKTLGKLINTYMEPWLRFAGHDGNIHPTYSATRNDEGSGTRTGRLACVAAHTKIKTSAGYKRIDEIRLGDEVFTHKERYKKVTRRWIKGVEAMISIKFSTGDILTCTMSHRLLRSDLTWVTAGEIINEYRKGVDGISGESRRSIGVIQEFGYPHSRGDSKETWNFLRERQPCSKQLHGGAGAQGVGATSLRGIEARGQKPDALKERKITSPMERRSGRWVRILDYFTRWKAAICASCSVRSSVGTQGNTATAHSPSHRWQSIQQLHRQSNHLHKQGTQTHTFFTGTGQPESTITAINFSGDCEVYDITVEDDESYLACGVFSHNSSEPNIQNVSNEFKPVEGLPPLPIMRRYLLPPEGAQWMVADFSGQEPRLAAHFAGGSMRRRFNDDHRWGIYEHGMQEVKDKYGVTIERKPFKTVMLGLMYGMGKNKLSEQLGVAVEEADAIKRLVVGVFPELKICIDEATTKWKANNTITTLGGRVVKCQPPTGQIQWDYKAFNMQIQGSAADQTKSLVIDFDKAFPNQLMTTVHDEVDPYFYPEQEKEMKECLSELANTSLPCSVPMVMDFVTGHNWAEATD